MGISYVRPNDQLAKLWCRGGESFRPQVWQNAYRESVYAPENLNDGRRDWICGNCGGKGTMVWVWGRHLPDPRKPIPQVSAPAQEVQAQESAPVAHCGNPSCEGFCSDPLCLPADVPKSEAESPGAVIGAIAMLALSALAGGALVWFLK